MKNYTKKNILKLKPSSTLAINEKCKKLINQGKKVYQFGFGQSPFPVPEKIVNALKENAHRKEYLPMQGLIELRESISKYLINKTGINYPKVNKKFKKKIITSRKHITPFFKAYICYNFT